jgi:signal transduction histidine kinase
MLTQDDPLRILLYDVLHQVETLLDSMNGATFADDESVMHVRESATNLVEMVEQATEMVPGIALDNISHRIRSPLSVIIGFAELWQADDDLTLEQCQLLKSITNNGMRLSSMIDAAFG